MGKIARNLDKGEANLKKFFQKEPSKARPSFAFAHLLLRHLYRMQEKKDLARSGYEKDLNLDPDFEMARKKVKEL